MLMFQLYPKFLKSNIPILISIMMEALSLRAPPMASLVPPGARIDPSNKRLYFSRARELVAAQAKTLSFLTYLLRGFSNELKPYEDRLASNVVALMSTCPRESISTRKELLVATRHLLNSEFRTGFFRHVDALLDERVLMGCNHRYSEQTVLRPLGYTALSDLIHHVKTRLTMPQMSRVVCMFSRILHDSSTTLPLSTQYTAVRTLLSVVEIIFQNKDPNPQIGRDMLVRILSTLVNKLSTLNEYFSAIQKREGSSLSSSSTSATHNVSKDVVANSEVSAIHMGSDPALIYFGASHSPFAEDHQNAFLSDRGDLRERNSSFDGNVDVSDSLRDLRSMIRAIVVGHKTVIWYINNYRSQREKDNKTPQKTTPAPGSNEEVSSAMLKMTHSERALVDKYILLGIPCMKFLKEDVSTQGNETTTGKPTAGKQASSDQYKDVLSYFAAAFTTLDGYDLKRTLGKRLDVLVEAIVDDPTVMVIPRHLLGSNATTSYEFCAILLRFLVERMDDLSVSKSTDIRFFGPLLGQNLRDVETSNPLLEEALSPKKETPEKSDSRAIAYLQLFERVLKSLTVYPDNESALRPHLRRIVSTCLRSSMENANQWPDNYCMLLRYVFRSISAGKFEESYKEILPLIPASLNGLYRVIIATDSSLIKNTIIELCLTIPARLSSLLPHMNLLLRVIVLALSSNSGDLVNLGLRTLEFWVDNLNPDFLYPELSKQTLLFTELMQALSRHLRPAPYPYGLLTLRLLGKLGGKNRRFLREPIDACADDKITEVLRAPLALQCAWLCTEAPIESDTPPKDAAVHSSGVFALPLPLARCVETLKLLAASEGTKEADPTEQKAYETDAEHVLLWKDSEKLWDLNVEDIDFASYCSDVMDETRQTQALSAFRVIRAALASTLADVDTTKCTFEVSEFPTCKVNDDEMKVSDADTQSEGLSYSTQQVESRNNDFVNMSLGVMYSCIVENTREDAIGMLKGFSSYMYYVILSHHDCFKRIDANGSQISDDLCELSEGGEADGTEKPPEGGQDDAKKSSGDKAGSQTEYERLGSLKPFGYFHRVGVLRENVDPLLFNRSLARFLAEASPRSTEVGLLVVQHMLSKASRSVSDGNNSAEDKMEVDSEPAALHRGAGILFENLLSNLCVCCFSQEWNQRDGLQKAICVLIESLGSAWGLKYESEIMNVAFSAVKSVPRELSTAVVKAFSFFVRVCCGLYGRNSSMAFEDSLVWDVLAVTKEKKSKKEADTPAPVTSVKPRIPCATVMQVLFTEMASSKQIVRVSARFLLKHFITSRPQEECQQIFKDHMAMIRRVIFSRSLRLLPLAEQVGAVEALAFIVKEAQFVLPLSDQHLLAFLSELLKMSSVADGEMTDLALAGYVVDKDGHALTSKKSTASGSLRSEKCPSHASAIFFRRECILEMGKKKFAIPEELPHGIQLRVSSISLLHSVIIGHPNDFFDAEVSTPIGNIRPHVISLLFRSLVSNPLKAVVTAHEALRQVLTLSVVAKENPEKARSQSRLPKELLQTCIRPVLLNLREYTRLSVPLLRGLSRLLSLLSSWFNKTLGEKLLDHLQKWTDPALIKSHKIWTPGEEPSVAAAIIDLFSLLPHASHFVEPLVKTTIKLEAYLPGFNAHCIGSPYRKPLARYLNKHCQYTVGFFFQRLKAPIYSELFQQIIRLEECSALRQYLSGRQCSVMMLNVCFERPLAIIRSEKTNPSASAGTPGRSPSSKTSTSEVFQLHGIQTSAPPIQREGILRQDMEVKKKKLAGLQQEHTKAKGAMQTATAGPGEDEAKRKHQLAKVATEKGTKELNEAKQRFAAEFARSGDKIDSATTATPPTPRSMNTESLELQHQGFMLVEALISNNDTYLQEHNDVVRAFRWLWRSKGRYLRLQHEDSVSPRYHEESKILVSFLQNYAKAFPNDVDVLFELIRIFLQPATTDFSFVRNFLSETIRSLEIERKKQVFQRFFALLAGESTEETKALSIQLLLFPLLTSTLKPQGNLDGQEDGVTTSQADRDEKTAAESLALVDSSILRKFVSEVLYNKGNPISCGDRLKVELLRVTNLLLEYAPERMDEFQNDIIRFCWSLIKSEDALCKAWAYVVVCRLISLFETQPKKILQVYAALLRSHQQEGKHLVRAALTLLVPALKTRLTADDFKKSMECTSRIMFEDGSVPQLAHIWHTIVLNPEVYYAHCQCFVRYMVNSLNRLGLPPNSPAENRALAVSMIGLLIQWWGQHAEKATAASCPLPLKRKAESTDSSPTKKSKDNTGAAKPVIIVTEDSSLLDKSMVETILNFLVRLKVLLADPKVDSGPSSLHPLVTKVFRSALSRWESTAIRPIYFEKVVSLCKEEAKQPLTTQKKPTKTVKASKSSSSAKASNSDEKKAESNLVTTGMLAACLDIFTALTDEAPQNNFLAENSDQLKAILGSCFRHVGQTDGQLLSSKLRLFVAGLYRASVRRVHVYEEVLLFINACLEKFLLDTPTKISSIASLADKSSTTRGKEKSEASEEKDSDSHIVQFSLEIIEDVCNYRRDYFMVFASSLLSLGARMVKKHLADTSAKQRQGASHSQQSGTSGIPQMYATPTVGILDVVCAEDPTFGISSVAPKSASPKQGSHLKDSIPAGSALRSLVVILRLLGTSDIPYVFSEDRKHLLHILGSILDGSDNVQLLMTAVKVIGKWLLPDSSGGALTAKERNNFLWKIASFDFFNGLPDVDSQPLADLVAHYIITVLEKRLGTDDMATTVEIEESRTDKASESDDLVMGRLLAACLLNANAAIRYKLLCLYAAQGSTAYMEDSATQSDSRARQAVTAPRSALKALRQLLYSDYEGLGGRCWILVFVEMLIESSISTGGVLLSSKAVTEQSESPWLPPPVWTTLTTTAIADSPNELKQFIEALSEQKTSSSSGLFGCLRALQVLAHGDIHICKILFDAMLPAAWDQIPNDETRLRLVPAIESLLARPFHSQFFRQSKISKGDGVSTNSVRFFTNTLLMLSPKPFLDTKLLVMLAENYNCWHEVGSLLEQQYSVLTENKVGTTSGSLADDTLSAMRHCHRHLGDTGLWMSLAMESCTLPESEWALAFDLYGMVEEASEAYSQLVDRYQNDDPAMENASDFELAMWEERWVELQRELCQQQVVSEFANLSENPMLSLESAWKSQDWDKVRQLVASPPLVAAVESGDPKIKMSETLLAVADGKLSDVENSHAQAAQLCLYKWQQLPKISRGSQSHASLLHYFHRLVEIRESGQIMVETSNHSTGRTLPDLKNLLNAWRHRLPNDYEKLTIWDDVFTWRSHMFSAITKNFQWSEPNTLATLHDTPWTDIRIAKTARKQGTRDVALLLLNKLTGNRSMDVTDAFLKLREQILAYDNPNSDLERTGGLNLINTTNLAYFDAPQKSEIFRLKALFLASLGLRSKSNQAFCHSVQICPSHARAWVSWGGLCSNLGALTEKQMEQAAAKSGTEASKETRANTAKKVAQYLAQSMGCYFEAIHLNSHEWSRIHLPKCLLMLVKDGSSPGVLCQTMENRGSALPPWVWLPWIPHLLSCLCRNEGRAVKAILMRLVKAYPQAVYYALRAFYLERRDVERTQGTSPSPGSHMASVALAEELMSTLRRSHASLWSSLEAILEELIVKFRPSYEEELLATITALIERADSGEKGKVDDPDAMVSSVSKTLGRIAVKFFRTTPDTNSSRNDERARKTAEFKIRYKAQFEAEFKVSASEKEQAEKGPQFSLTEYLLLLKRWRRRLEVQVAATPSALPLMESSQSLSLFASDAPELWPGACDPRSSNSSQPDRLQSNFETDSRTSQSSTSSSAAAAQKAASMAAKAAATAAAKEGVGGDYGGGSASIELPGQYAPNICSSDLKPNPELHAKLIRFEPSVQVLRREQLVRRIGMVGSDGRVYRFLLQFAIPYWTRTDERVAQTHYVLDKVLRKEFLSARQNLSVQPTAVIPVAQRLRMTADSNSRMSLDEVYKQHCQAKGEDVNKISNIYNHELAKVLEDDETMKDDSKPSGSSRLEVLQSASEKVDNALLLRHMTAALGDPESLFHFRRAFSDQLAANSLLQYAFSVAERTPARLVFTQGNGRVQSPDFRVTYSSQGFIESRPVAFRMTPNIQALIGLPLMNGRFITSFATVADSVKKCKEEMDPILRLLMRDDIVAWYCKSMAKSDSKLQELEKQLADRVSKNVSYLQARFAECAPKKVKDMTKERSGRVDQKVRDLMAAASDPAKLSTMPTNYQAWL